MIEYKEQRTNYAILSFGSDDWKERLVTDTEKETHTLVLTMIDGEKETTEWVELDIREWTKLTEFIDKGEVTLHLMRTYTEEPWKVFGTGAKTQKDPSDSE